MSRDATSEIDGLWMRVSMVAYRLGWLLGLPVALVYLWWRGRKDPLYRQHLADRFGLGPRLPEAVWVHAVSLGEMRSAVPLVRALLDRGERVITTHLTPAGRREAQKVFRAEIAENRVLVRYVPFEIATCLRAFLNANRPKYCLVMEIEIWPLMIVEARRADVPLVLCNTQYPAKSFARDRRNASFRGKLVQAVAGALVKSETHAERFRTLKTPNVRVTGELRFDQPVPPGLLTAADNLQAAGFAKGRPVVTLASVVEGEDAQYLDAMSKLQSRAEAQGKPRPLFIYVPRAPERFDEVAALLADAGQKVVRRSTALYGDLVPDGDTLLAQCDVFLGDSMGEMYFYLALADQVIVGGGYVPKGAHNVIEPLALKKPVFVGPHVWTIEYPGVEAIEAGVLTKCDTIEALVAALSDALYTADSAAAFVPRITAFYDAHAGATAQTLRALDAILNKGAPDADH